MELYIVYRSDYEDTTILGIFDNEDKVKRITEINHAEYSYKEYKLNQLTEDGIYEITSYIKDLKEDLNLLGE